MYIQILVIDRHLGLLVYPFHSLEEAEGYIKKETGSNELVQKEWFDIAFLPKGVNPAEPVYDPDAIPEYDPIIIYPN